MNVFGILFLIVFIVCFSGAAISGFIGNETLAIVFVFSLFGIVILALLIDKTVKAIKIKNIAKNGKKVNAKVVGATHGGRKEVNTVKRHEITEYYYPIFATEDMFGVKTYYTSVKSVKGVELQQLVNKGEVKLTVYKNVCKVDEDFSLLPSAFPPPYLGKNMLLDDNGIWVSARVDTKNKKGKNRQGLNVYKLTFIILSVITLLIIGGAVALSVYGVKSKQYDLIIGAVIAVILTSSFEVRTLVKMLNGLNVDKKGSRTYARDFTTDVEYYHSSQGGSTTNYVVDFSFRDQFGNVQNTREIVMEDVYFIVRNMQTLPIKVYKKHAIIDYEKLSD